MFQENQHLRPGTTLFGGRYRITRFIGAGGFGCTYEAEFVPMHSRVAIKEFFVNSYCNRDTSGAVTIGASSQAALVGRLREKFRHEAQRQFNLKHPGIVSVTDMIEDNGTSYYVMDYIDGRSLQRLIEDEGPLPEARALRYIGQVMDALEYVHGQNMLHLDIKPDNIMIDGKDNAILIDFGISKQYDEVDGHNTSTIMGQTPGYAPPEQADNSIQNFTPASDIYSLGATLYCVLTGIVPASSAKIISGSGRLAPLPAGTSPAIQAAIAKMMQPNVKQRPQTVAAARVLLAAKSAPYVKSFPAVSPLAPETPVSHKTAPIAPSHEPKPVGPKPKSKKWLWAVIAALAVIEVAAAILLLRKEFITNSDSTAVVTDTIWHTTEQPIAGSQQVADDESQPLSQGESQELTVLQYQQELRQARQTIAIQQEQIDELRNEIATTHYVLSNAQETIENFPCPEVEWPAE